MSSKITICTSFPGVNQPGANEAIELIRKHPSPEQFKLFCRQHPEYKLEYGNSNKLTGLEISIFLNNIPLAIHIIHEGGCAVANQGDKYGLTPLMWILCELRRGKMHLEPEKTCLLFAKALHQAGGDFNLATSKKSHLYYSYDNHQVIPKHATPLWILLNFRSELGTIYFLSKLKAQIHPALTEFAKKRLQLATFLGEIMDEKRRQEAAVLERLKPPACQGTYLGLIPLDLTKKALGYLYPPRPDFFDKQDLLLKDFVSHLSDIVTSAENLAKKKLKGRLLPYQGRMTTSTIEYRRTKISEWRANYNQYLNPCYSETFGEKAQKIVTIGKNSILSLNGYIELVDQMEKDKDDIIAIEPSLWQTFQLKGSLLGKTVKNGLDNLNQDPSSYGPFPF